MYIYIYNIYIYIIYIYIYTIKKLVEDIKLPQVNFITICMKN